MAVVAERSLLDSVEETLKLSKTELARLFGVRRQAIDGWRENGLPASRQEKAGTVAAIAELLSHSLKPDRIPGAVRRPAAVYGGKTILEMIEQGRHRDVLEEVRRSFDWAVAA